jgi:hypothetical protein
MAQVAECLLCKNKAINPSPTKRKKLSYEKIDTWLYLFEN